MQKQDLNKLQTRKLNAFKRSRLDTESTAANNNSSADTGENQENKKLKTE
jgi:hypothetical protein